MGLVDRHQHRVALADEQPAPGTQQRGHDPGPVGDVGQPVQRPDARVDEIERRLAQRVDGAVDV